VPTLDGVLPGLTGLRGAAVAAVVLGHVGLAQLGGSAAAAAGHVAQLGVQVFFVLSGFLITTLLSRELGATGRVSLGRFYARRALRLLPPLYVFLAVVLLLGSIGALAISRGDVVAAGLHVWNYSGAPPSAVAHTWSLNVEEHYYLVFPLLFVLLSRRQLVVTCVVVVALSPGVRSLSYAFATQRGSVENQTHNRVDALLVGCLLSLCWGSPRLQRALRFAARPLGSSVVGCALLGSVVAQLVWGPWLMMVVVYTVQALLVALLIGGLQQRGGPVRATLDSRVLVHLGVISYSVYLWQQLFTLPTMHAGWTHTVAAGLVLPVAIAELSYRAVERPLSRVRHRLR
jgi:peptidoglycan/LPS O-acetylase OafA/YrhL